jgi:hypothetical protein
MFARFRQTKRRLQVSVVATSRVAGKVRHEHVASLGSIHLPSTVAGRCSFWARVHNRLGNLSNRIDAYDYGKIIHSICARVAIPTIDEQHELYLTNAKNAERLSSTMQDAQPKFAEANKAQIAEAERRVSDSRAQAENAARERDEARERRGQLERKNAERLTGRELFEMAIRFASLKEAQFGAWLVEVVKRQKRLDMATIRAVLRKSKLH